MLRRDSFLRVVVGVRTLHQLQHTTPGPDGFYAAAPPCGTSSVPGLRAAGAPTRGRAQFGIEVVRASANSGCALLVGLDSADLRLNAVCSVNVDPTTIVFTLPGRTDGNGFALWAMPVSTTPALSVVTLHAQAAVAGQSGAFAGLDLTKGLRLVVGD